MESEAHIVDAISILVSLDQAYLPQLQVLLTSIFCNNPGERFNVYLLHSGISDQDLAPVAEQCRRMQDSFCPIRVQEDLFAWSPPRPGNIPGRCTTGCWRDSFCPER